MLVPILPAYNLTLALVLPACDLTLVLVPHPQHLLIAHQQHQTWSKMVSRLVSYSKGSLTESTKAH
jgi:hypothetical protein